MSTYLLLKKGPKEKDFNTPLEFVNPEKDKDNNVSISLTKDVLNSQKMMSIYLQNL